MKKPTPGPWVAETVNGEWHVFHNDPVCSSPQMPHIACVSHGTEPDPTGEANAHLMAAAPELLSACELALKLLEGFESKWGIHGFVEEVLKDAIRKAKVD